VGAEGGVVVRRAVEAGREVGVADRTLDITERHIAKALEGLLALQAQHRAAGRYADAERMRRAFVHLRRAWALSVWAERVRQAENEDAPTEESG
jgi:hypothetical protein